MTANNAVDGSSAGIAMCPIAVLLAPPRRNHPQKKSARSVWIRPRTVFQVHGIDAAGKAIIRRQLRRNQVLADFAKLTPGLIGLEACATSHHWARELKTLGEIVSGEDNRIAELARDCLVANISDARAFASGRDLSAWIGPVPKQHANGGKAHADSISKAGNRSLRQLLFVGAMALIRRARQLGCSRHPWLVALMERRPLKAASTGRTYGRSRHRRANVIRTLDSPEPSTRNAFRTLAAWKT